MIIISKQKIFFVGLIIILLLGLSVVTASDNTTVKDVKVQKTVTKATPTSNINTKAITKNKQTNVTKKVTNKQEKNVKSISKTTDKHVKKASNKDINSYQELYNTLTTSQDNDLTINLKGNTYKITDTTNQIQLNDNIKKLVINGNNKTIDGNKKFTFLKSKSNNDITINNLTIANCSGNTSALYKTNGKLTLNNVKFINNKVNYTDTVPIPLDGSTDYEIYGCGAAIYSENVNLTIKNCYFDSNQAEEPGGAICINYAPSIKIDNTVFKDNHATDMGGAIFYFDELYEGTSKTSIIINNTNFISNGDNDEEDEETSMGGALYLEYNGTAIIDNCNFTENFATGEGGAICSEVYQDSTLDIKNSKFNSNGYIKGSQKFTEMGGALLLESTGTAKIYNCEFNDNFADIYGGSICLYGPNVENANPASFTINKTTFNSSGKKDNNITFEGGAIFMDVGNDVVLDDCKFTNNYGKFTSALYYYSNVQNEEDNPKFNILNSKFDSNENVLTNDDIMDNDIRSLGTLTINSIGNVTISNSNFTKNNGLFSTPIYYSNPNNNANLVIKDSLFDSNGLKKYLVEEKYYDGDVEYTYKYYGTMNTGALISENNGKTKIINSKFNNNYAISTGAISLYEAGGSPTTTNTEIINSTISSNAGGNIAAIESYIYNLTITNTNITNNKFILEDEFYIEDEFEEGEIREYRMGHVLYSHGELTINYTNFLGNGVPSNLSENIYAQQTGGIIYHSTNYNVTIDNSNFTSNYAVGDDGGVIYYDGTYTPSSERGIYTGDRYTDSRILINNTIFRNNKVFSRNPEERCNGLVLCIYGESIIDNTKFIFNKFIPNSNSVSTDDESSKETFNSYVSGVIYHRYYTCNVTNCDFINNDPENYIINNNGEIVRNEINGYMLDDDYVPNWGDVTFYEDENTQGTQYQLITIDPSSEMDNPKVVVDGLTVPEGHRIYKIIVNQTENSDYYGTQTFLNNAYYFIMPEYYTLTINAKTPVTVGENTTIKGKAFYIDENEEVVFISNEYVKLYVDEVYIGQTLTNSKGEYEFKYTTTEVGTINIEVKIDESDSLPILTNSTNVTVRVIESILNIKASETTLGEKTNITFILKGKNGKIISNAYIHFFVDTIEGNGTTNKDGTFVYECKLDHAGPHYVIAYFDGDKAHRNATTTTTFEINRIKTVIIIKAPDTSINQENIITGKIVDGNNNQVGKVPITLLINDQEIKLETTANGEFTYKHFANQINENFVAVIFEGDDDYINSFNSTVFNVASIKTTITLNIKDTTINEKIIVNGKLTDYNKKPVKNAKITLNLADKQVNLNTDNNGNFKYETTATTAGQFQAIAIYDGDYGYTNSLNKTYFTVNKLNSKISISATNSTVNGETTIQGKLQNNKNNPIANAQVTIIYDGKKITTVKTNTDGTYTYKYTTPKEGNYNIEATFLGDNKYAPSTKNTKINVIIYRIKTNIAVKTVKAYNGDTVNLEATVTDENGKPVNTGKVVFKVNMKTLADKNGNAIYVTVKNGKATLQYKPEKGLYSRNSDLTATYCENDKYTKSDSKTAKLQLYKETAKIVLEKETIKTEPFKNVTIKLKVVANDGSIIKSGKVIFKINGKTFKTVSIKDGFVTLTYNLGNKVAKIYEITAVYSSDKYGRVQNTVNVIVNKISTKIKANDIVLKSAKANNKNTVTVKAKILDNKNKNIKFQNKVTIKINGITYKNEVVVKNGEINIKVPTKLSKGKYTISILSGTTGYYTSSRKDIKLTIV